MRFFQTFILILVAVFVFLIYANTLTGPFVFDDRPNILYNQDIQLKRLTCEEIKKAAFEGPCANRPVAKISFALNYYLHQYTRLGFFVGYLQGYHLVNILVHIITGILLYFFVKTLLNLPLLRSRYAPSGWIALFTALVWLVHPIQTQSVSYIVQRMNSMAAMFHILSLLLYVKARLSYSQKARWTLYAGCAFSGMLALCSKETAATLPFFVLLFEWYFFQDLSRVWIKRRALFFTGMLFFFTLIAIAYLGVDPVERILADYKHREFTLPQRVLTEFRVVIFYIGLLFFPHPSRLNLDHDCPLSLSLVDPATTLLSIAAVLGLIGAALYLSKRERLISFCILWFFGNLVIESSVIGLEIIFEHRTYLPSMLVSLLTVALIYRFLKLKLLRGVILCALVMISSVWTHERNLVWSDEITLWSDCVKKSPKKARAHTNLGNALRRQGKFEEAIFHYSKALEIDPKYEKAHLGISFTKRAMGKKRIGTD